MRRISPRTIAGLVAVAAAFSTSAMAQSFTNLDFEAADTGGSGPFGVLPWSAALPGWQHTTGADTGAVYLGTAHVGTTQWFMLTNAAFQPSAVLAGNHSVQFVSGYESSVPGSAWVNAALFQSGTVPATARSLRLLATGPLEVRINGNVVPLISTGTPAFAVDLSGYAGTFAEIRFVNAASQLSQVLTLDAIEFSTTPVPEPASWALMGLGVLALLGRRRPR